MLPKMAIADLVVILRTGNAETFSGPMLACIYPCDRRNPLDSHRVPPNSRSHRYEASSIDKELIDYRSGITQSALAHQPTSDADFHYARNDLLWNQMFDENVKLKQAAEQVFPGQVSHAR